MTPVGPTPIPLVSALPPAQAPTRGILERILREPNAIWMREMRQSARLGRTPWVLFAMTLTISLLMCCIGGLAAASDAGPASIGSMLFQTFFSLAYFVVTIIGPAIAANGIASEREGRTWEAVLLTGLTPTVIARGKFLAAYTSIALYIVVLAPVGALSFLFGGVTATEVAVAFIYLFLLAALFVAFGLAVSSLMSSMRMAIVLTLILSICIGTFLYVVVGLGGSFPIHGLWSEVPDWHPVWLPIAYPRAEFGIEYVLYLIVLPLLAIVIPGWFLYEVTISNLTAENEDRSTGLKVWFALVTPLFALACAAPGVVVDDSDASLVLAISGIVLFLTHLTFSALLFAHEPHGPSRRVRIHWMRDRAGFIRRFFGPGVAKASLLATLYGFFGIFIIAFAVIVSMYVRGAGASWTSKHEQMVFLCALYLAPFFVFIAGLVAWLRSRGNTPWVTRLLASAVLLLVMLGPWVVAAIGGALANHSGSKAYLVIGSPSPFYLVAMLAMVDGTTSPPEGGLILAGVVCALLWGLVGLVLLSVASTKCHRMVAQHDAAIAAADAALRAEDEAMARAAAAPPTDASPA